MKSCSLLNTYQLLALVQILLGKRHTPQCDALRVTWCLNPYLHWQHQNNSIFYSFLMWQQFCQMHSIKCKILVRHSLITFSRISCQFVHTFLKVQKNLHIFTVLSAFRFLGCTKNRMPNGFEEDTSDELLKKRLYQSLFFSSNQIIQFSTK